MTSEIRANTLKNRVGLGTVSFTNTGPVVSGIVTIANSTAAGVRLEDNAGVGGSLKITTPSGYVSIGAGNATFVHLNTDRGIFYFQKRITVDEGIISSYDENLVLQSPMNTTRLTINKTTGLVSIVNDLDVDGHTNLDNVSVAGISTFQDIDVDGHTNLDNVSVAGIVTASQGLRVPNGSDSSNYISVGNGGGLRLWGTSHQFADIRAGNLHFRNTSLQNILELQQDKDIFLYGPSYFLDTARFDSTVTIADTITHHGDTDTKIRFPAADTISAETAGSERLRIDSSGQLKLPSRTAETNNATAPDHFVINRSDSTAPLISMGAHSYAQSTSTPGAVISANHRDFIITKFSPNFSGNSPGFWLRDNYISMFAGSSERVRIDSSGYLIAKADIRLRRTASDNGALYFGDTNNNYIFGSDADDVISFATAGSERLRIASDGKVGINRTSPAELLDVYGTIQCSGAGLKIDTHPIVSYASFTDISGGSYAARLGSTGTSTVRSTQIYGGGNHIATFDGVNYRLGVKTTKPQTALDVRGTISTGRNVARELGTVINVSSNHDGTRVGANVINGNKNYEAGADWLAQGNARTNANLTIDLGSSISCDRFVIYNQNEYQNSHREVKRFTLEGSNDNSSWTTILDDNAGCSNAHEPNPGWSFRMPADRDDDEEGVSYRYWRFTMKDFHGSDAYGGIMELELYEQTQTIQGTSEVTTHSLVATDVSAEIVRANGQPAFSVARSSTFPSSGNYSANTTIIFDDDSGNGYFQTGTTPHCNYYNTSNGLFTAPVSGIYFFTTTVLVQNSTGNYDLIIKTTPRDFYCAPGRKASNPGSTSWSTSGTVYLAFGGDCIVYLTKGQTAEVRFSTFGGGQIYGSGSWTRFAGYLLG